MGRSKDVEKWLRKGAEAFESGALSRAREAFDEAYWETDGPDPEVALWLGKLELCEGNLEAAAYWVYEAVNAAPAAADVLDEFARIAVHYLSAARSLAWARRFARARPDHPACRRLVARIQEHRQWVRKTLSTSKRLRRAGSYAEAADRVSRALEAAPAEIKLLNEQGQIAFEKGDVSEARRHFLAAHRLDPADPYATNNMAKSYARESRTRPAQKWYRRTLEHHPDDAFALVGLGNLEMQRHRYDAARSWFELALEGSPNDGVARRGLERCLVQKKVLDAVQQAKTLRRRRELAKAEKFLLKVAAELDNPVPIVVELGLIAHGAGRFDDARNLFVLAYQREPHNILILNMLGALETATRPRPSSRPPGSGT